MSWNNILSVLAILGPVFLGLWGIMRSIKEEMRSIKTDLKGDMRSLKDDMRSVESSLKEDIRSVETRLNNLEIRVGGLEKETAAINVKLDFLSYDSREDRKHG